MEFIKRFLRHVWMSPIQLRRCFSEATLEAIGAAIAAGEKTHAGQVRFVVEAELSTRDLWAGVTSRQRGIEVFSRFRVWDTAHNNGVLVYVLLADHKVEIIADRGIQKRVGDERWRAICREMELHFRKREFRDGAIAAVEKISAELAHYYPPVAGQHNEQPDAPIVI